jgi:hypothetical protein
MPKIEKSLNLQCLLLSFMKINHTEKQIACDFTGREIEN